MNIFKILASGYGRTSETNVSAFLGYILNPKADHGLNAEFLKAFIQPLIKKETKKAGIFQMSFGISIGKMYVTFLLFPHIM